MSLREKLIKLFYESATGNQKIRNLFTFIGAVFFFALIVIFILVSLLVDKFLELPKFIPAPLNIIVSIPFLAIGLLLGLWSVLYFHKAKGTPMPFNPPPKLITTGPYAYVRNPMITGLFILLFGFGILLQSTSFIFIFTPLFILLTVMELKSIEEPELEKRFGREYVEYKKRVPMFIPRLKMRTKNGL